MKFRTKIMSALLVLGLAPAAIITYIDINRVYSLSEHTARSSVEGVFEFQRKAIEDYFANLTSAAHTMSYNPKVVDAAVDFASAPAFYHKL